MPPWTIADKLINHVKSFSMASIGVITSHQETYIFIICAALKLGSHAY